MHSNEDVEKRIKLYTHWLAEDFPAHEIIHKNFADTLPYRWEIHLREPARFLTRLTLKGPDISHLYKLSEADQRSFLYSMVSDVIRKALTPQN